MLLHVLGHVDLDHRAVVAEEELSERAGELGLADTRGAEEDERARRALRILDAGTRATDRTRDGGDCHVLTDHALVEFFLHADQLLRFGLGQLEDRDTGPHRDDVGDLFLADRRLLGSAFALGPALLGLALVVRELALLIAKIGGCLEVLAFDRRLLLLADALDLVFQLALRRRCGHRPDSHARSGLVDQIDCLVRQVPILDVATRQLGRGDQRLVRDADAVMRLVAIAQTTQDLDRVLDGWLFDTNLLEPARQRLVALEVLAVLIERRGTNRLQLATRQGRLENAGRVDRAFGSTRAYEVMQLVDKEDDVATQRDLLHHLLQALLELAAILRTGHESRQVERVDLLILEQIRDLTTGDALGEPLDDGRLADAWLADQHGVVLHAADENLHHPLDLSLASNDRVELAFGR